MLQQAVTTTVLLVVVVVATNVFSAYSPTHAKTGLLLERAKHWEGVASSEGPILRLQHLSMALAFMKAARQCLHVDALDRDFRIDSGKAVRRLEREIGRTREQLQRQSAGEGTKRR